MSSKSLDLANDVASLQNSINEVISVTGSILITDSNVKFYKNIASSSVDPDLGGYWETLYDSNPTSSLSTAIFDLTYGFATGSSYNLLTTNSSSQAQKVKIYKEFAGLLLGNKDSLFNINGIDRKEAVFISVKRDIFKDEFKKGTVNVIVNSNAPTQYTASDQGAAAAFEQTVGGDFAPLKYNGTGSEVGQVWYQTGIIVLHPDTAWGAVALWSGSKSLANIQSSGCINNVVDGVRKKTERIDFHNQTNIRSTVYFCRAGNKEFNYSSNPTFIDSNKRIRVTSGSNNQLTRTYVTTIGLYDADDNLLAVGKLNKPVLKSPENEAIFRLRIDY